MINDVLEQLAEDYFRHLGYFTQHNVKYRPNKKGPAYAVHSDIDIVAIHPKIKGVKRVLVVSSKSWWGGIRIKRDLDRLKRNYRKTRQTFREVSMPEWSKALKAKIKAMTGQSKFTFCFVCVKYKTEDKELWEKNRQFRKNLSGCTIELLDMKTMVEGVQGALKGVTPAHSELTRLLQMMNYSGAEITYKEKK